MSVSGVSNSTGVSTVVAGATSNTAATAAATDSSTELTDALLKEEADTYEKGDTSKPKTYTRDTAKIAELNAGQKAYIQNLQSLVSELVNQVGKNQTASGASNFYGSNKGGIDPSKVDSYWDVLVQNKDGTFSFDPSLSVEDQDKLIAKAKEDIGENGYYGVDQTSKRILDYAKAITGGDPSKIGEMRKMAEQAFGDVKKLTGGKLPDISQQTYDAVMKGFDEWEAEATAKTST